MSSGMYDAFFEYRLLAICGAEQGRNETRWRPGQEASLVPLCSNLRSFWNKYTVLKKVLVTLFGIFGAPLVIQCRELCLFWPLVTSLEQKQA